MRTPFHYYLVLLLVHVGFMGYTQDDTEDDQTKLDSLTAIVKSSVHDTIKTKTYYQIGLFHYYKGAATQSVDAWAAKLEIEIRCGDKQGTANSLNLIGAAYKIPTGL